MITEWTPSERIVLTKNPNYVGGWDNSKIVSDSITLLLLEDSSASFAAYNSGEAVLIKDVPTDEIPSLTKAEDGGDFYVDTILGTYYVSLNLKRDAFKDAKVRKALSLAIDRDYVANTIMQAPTPPPTASLALASWTRTVTSTTTAMLPTSLPTTRQTWPRLRSCWLRLAILTARATPPSSTAATMPATMCLWQSTCSRLGAIWASP